METKIKQPRAPRINLRRGNRGAWRGANLSFTEQQEKRNFQSARQMLKGFANIDLIDHRRIFARAQEDGGQVMRYSGNAVRLINEEITARGSNFLCTLLEMVIAEVIKGTKGYIAGEAIWRIASKAEQVEFEQWLRTHSKGPWPESMQEAFGELCINIQVLM